MYKNNLKKILLVSSILYSSILYSDQVIHDDLIVDGSTCVGIDCINGEAFNFDTLRLKENNLRIYFQDTSSSASFPGHDWKITINDSANGGENYFSVDSVDNNLKLLKISPDGTINMGRDITQSFVLTPSGDLSIKGTISDSSDINLKENIVEVNSSQILSKVINLPISTWNYKENKNKDRHIGSMAQDFYKAFQYGPDNLHISPKDAAFVAIVGVQELNKKIELRDKKIYELQQKLEKLELVVNKLLKNNIDKIQE